MVLEMHSSLAVHMGEWIKTEIVAPHAIAVKALTAHLGESRRRSNLINGHASLSPDMALRFENGLRRDGQNLTPHATLAQLRAPCRRGELLRSDI
jgi:plasmid maintenance system antidote protein VapI